jgi:uncharacterized protein (TIGR03083 family)
MSLAGPSDPRRRNRPEVAVRRDRVTAVFSAEAEQLASVMLSLERPDWSRPTGCPPWTTAELLGHVLTVIAWIPGMLAAPAPAQAVVSVIDYYRPDERFSAKTNAERIELARQRAADAPDGHALAIEFDHTWRQVHRICEQQPADRVVRTRHGDAMLLTDFLATRIVELGIHGLDLADALDRTPWLTPAASDLLTDLLLGGQNELSVSETLNELGWDEFTFLRKATGRRPLTSDETRQIEQRGIRWLTLG